MPRVLNLPDDSSTNLLGSRLGHIERYKDRQGTNTKAGNPSSHDNTNPLSVGDGDLNGNTDDEDQAPPWNGSAASNLVGEWCGKQSTDQSTDTEKSDNQTGSDVGEVESAIRVLLAETLKEVVHLEEARNLASVITKDEASHGSNDRHDDGPDSHARHRAIIESWVVHDSLDVGSRVVEGNSGHSILRLVEVRRALRGGLRNLWHMEETHD